MPYTLALILTGLGISIFKIPIGIELEPEMVMTIFLPALLFEGAMNIDVSILKRNIKSITLLSLVGTLTATLVIAWVLQIFLRIPFSISLLFAAMIAPTDPIAVLGIFKELGVNKKLSVLIEGESLFNDGAAIVIFKIVLALIATGTFSFINGVSQFFRLFFGGLFLGFLIGYLVSRLVRKIDDSLIQLTITTILAYGSYILAEQLHLSGVVATVTAGLVMGGYGLNFLSSSTRLTIASFWEYFGFLLNSVIFLLIGAKLDILEFLQYKGIIAVAFLLVLIGRAIAIYGISFFINKVDDSGIGTAEDEYIEPKWQHVLVWGGIHGGLSMVLLLGINLEDVPLLAPYMSLLHALIFGVVFLSLVIQGSTMAFLLKKLGLVEKKDINKEYLELISKLIMVGAAEEETKHLYKSKFISKNIYQKKYTYFKKKKEQYEKQIATLLDKEKGIVAAQEYEIGKAILAAKKDALHKSMIKGVITEEIYHKFKRDLDDQMIELSSGH